MIVWVVALRAEAAPLAAALGLRAHSGSTPWPLYVDAEGSVALVASGVGRVRAAAACGWAQGFLEPPGSSAWVNVGVAGHSQGPVGRAVLAHRVVEVATRRAWFPPPPEVEFDSDTVFTVDRPETAFESPGAYDMEAAGFLDAVSRFASAELAQVVKVVSDTAATAPAELTAGVAGELVEAHLDRILELGRGLTRRSVALAQRRAEPDGLDTFLARWRFSATQRRELRRLLRRHAALSAGASPRLPDVRDGRGALESLAREVRRLAVGT